MMNMNSVIQDIKDLFWESTLELLNKDISPMEYGSTKDGSLVSEEIHKNDNIKQFQWDYLSNSTPRDIISNHIIPNFLLKMKIYANNINLTQDFSDSDDLAKYFDEQFERLETDVFISVDFNYLIMIPTFRVLFPNDTEEIVLDSHHIIKNLTYMDSPYVKKDFSDIPKSWSRRWERTANASIEVKYSIKKRLVNEPPYDENTNPMAPFNSLGIFNEFDEKIRSIYDFLLCYGRKFDFGACTFGEKYYIKLPPFFQTYDIFENFIISNFPPPYTYLDLNLPVDHPHFHDWVTIWNKDYNNFYKNFYSNLKSQEENRIFRYALEVLRTYINIPYDRINNFLLISTFEGLLFQGSIYKALNNNLANYGMTKKITENNKRVPCTKVFLEVCNEQVEYWQYIFQNKYPLSIKLNDFKTKEDIEYFIDLSFTYRNNIAHPEKITPINIRKEYLDPHTTMEETLAHFIWKNFPYFILFLLRIWLKKGFTTKTEWYNYIFNLIK